MKREIKFRAWDKKLKEWASVGFHVFGETTLFNLLQQYCFETKGESSSLDRLLNDIEVTQYTGLKDKNGKEIYEGDIVVSKGLGELSGSKPTNIGHMPKDIPHKVFFHEGAFKFRHNKRSINHCLSGLTIRYFSLEIIGNIYETPHLLNKEQSAKVSDTTKA